MVDKAKPPEAWTSMLSLSGFRRGSLHKRRARLSDLQAVIWVNLHFAGTSGGHREKRKTLPLSHAKWGIENE